MIKSLVVVDENEVVRGVMQLERVGNHHLAIVVFDKYEQDKQQTNSTDNMAARQDSSDSYTKVLRCCNMEESYNCHKGKVSARISSG